MPEEFYPPELGAEIALRTGLTNVERIDDKTAYGQDESGVTSGITLHAQNNALEEDLSQLEHEPTYFDRETLNIITREAFLNTLEGVARSVNRATLDRLFPGFDIEHPEDYEFKNSRVKFFVLPQEQFKSMNAAYEADPDVENSKQTSKTAGFTISESVTERGPFQDTRSVDLSEKAVIVMSETQKEIVDVLNKTDLTPEQRDHILQVLLQRNLSHELLHNLGVAKSLPRQLQEGVVSWYEEYLNPDDETDDVLGAEGINTLGYRYQIGVVSVVFNGLLESGLGMDEINTAFCSGNPANLEAVKGRLAERYGQINTDKLFSWDFTRPREAWNMVKGLEVNQHPQIGTFLEKFTYPTNRLT